MPSADAAPITPRTGALTRYVPSSDTSVVTSCAPHRSAAASFSFKSCTALSSISCVLSAVCRKLLTAYSAPIMPGVGCLIDRKLHQKYHQHQDRRDGRHHILHPYASIVLRIALPETDFKLSGLSPAIISKINAPKRMQPINTTNCFMMLHLTSRRRRLDCR